MKRYIAVVAVWVAAAALFAAINVQAKPGEVRPGEMITPDVVGMTVAQAVQAFAAAGFTQVPTVGPGNLDPAGVPDAIVVRQAPRAGSSAPTGYHGVLFIASEEPSPDPSESPTPSDEGGSTPTGEVEGVLEGDSTGDSGSLSFTL
jgi:beta-lactam-binding protein with PASTA domain